MREERVLLIIDGHGTIFEGRPLNWEAGHDNDIMPGSSVSNNHETIGIGLMGNFYAGSEHYTGNPTQAQLNSLITLVNYVQNRIPTINRIFGHHERCPGAYVENWMRRTFPRYYIPNFGGRATE